MQGDQAATPQRRDALDGGTTGPQLRRRRVRRRRLTALGLMLLLLVVIGFWTTAHYTSRSAYCLNCHEMRPYYTSWQASTHGDEAQCVDCHIPQGAMSYVSTKLFSVRELYVHLTEQVRAPVMVTREIPDENCTGCHPTPKSSQFATSSFDHGQHLGPCVDCHARLVHQSVHGTDAADLTTMEACFGCHDGTTATKECGACHHARHEDMGPCAGCHRLTDWTPQTTDHPFALTGAHAEVTCITCHTSAEMPTTCAGCHKPTHAQLGACDQCHSTKAWQPADFEHTGFALAGGHEGLACEKCHPSGKGIPVLEGTGLGAASPNCVSCHDDPHGGLSDCARCHKPTGWNSTSFEHPGVGEHSPTSMACGDCHPDGYASATCTRCHPGGAPVDD